ncbi:LysR family transcriptional regulator [Devosia lacusdianchii]|jgi:DNA-binding transcriptional LysR family regulator|uniref:LysR family transcriptional regulator n=1 Tax=Devosia lacusdianchii TaxID=2917991 RepID=UPI001F062C20|nr:LysR family transcriptional regulator [Devosia sp. JXJ CY 41]
MRRQMLENLFVFTHVAEALSFTLAAARLGLSKSAASTKVKALEVDLGVQLLNRSTRSLSLTDAGRTLLAESARVMADADDAMTGLKDRAHQPTGHLRIASSAGIGASLIAPLIPAFLDRYPGLAVELSLSQDVVDLAANGFDIALRMSDLIRDTDTIWQLCPVAWWLVASPSYLAGKPHPARPADLVDHRCILYSWENQQKPTWRLRSDQGIDAVAVGGAFRANGAEAILQATLNAGGISILPSFMCGQLVASGALVRLLEHHVVEGRYATHVNAVRPWTPRVPHTVRVFVEYMRQALTSSRPHG